MSNAWNSIDDVFSYRKMYSLTDARFGKDEHTDGEAYLTSGYNPPRTGPFLHPSADAARPANVQLMTSGFMTRKSLGSGYAVRERPRMLNII